MLGGYYDGDHCAHVQFHLRELRALAEEDRRARLARGSRSLRWRLGRLLLLAGTALAGPEAEEGAAVPPHALAGSLARDTAAELYHQTPYGLAYSEGTEQESDTVAALAWTTRRIGEWTRLVSCADVVRAYIPLEPYGLGYIAICPWARHRHVGYARLVVYDAINRWRCLETGESGTALDFVCRMEGVSREAALKVCLERWPIHASRLRHL